MYYPDLRDGQLQPGYTGIRPKVSGPNEAAADFIIHGPKDHGIAGLVNLYGIESPGLTASLAIADHVKALLQG
jgi:L-2-hydroxyglutarate oxidase LhgO